MRSCSLHMFPPFNPTFFDPTTFSLSRTSDSPPFFSSNNQVPQPSKLSSSLFVLKTPATASTRMVEEDHSFGSSILKYMMQDFTQLSTRQEKRSSSRSQINAGVPSSDEFTPTTAPPSAIEQVSSYGTSSLFLTVSYDRRSNVSDSSSKCMSLNASPLFLI